MKTLYRFFSFIVLIALFGCGSAGAPVTPPPTTGSTATDTSTGTGTATQIVLTPAQKQAIIDAITKLGSSAAQFGLDQWAKSNNTLATEVATALHNNIQTLLPLLNGQNVTFQNILETISSNLYVKIPPLVTIAIDGGSFALDQFYSVPGVQESDKIDFIKAFVNAVDNGCTRYLSEKPAIGSIVEKMSIQKRLK